MPLEERERTAEGSKPDETMSYGSTRDQVADMTFPTQRAEHAPLVVLFHGGFWRAEHDRLHVRVVADALADCGYAVANVEYRRIGAGGGWPTTFTDIAQAVDALPAMIEREHPGRIDHDAIVYAGHSAGGQLALWAALRDRLPGAAPGWTANPPRIAGVLALAAVTDLAQAHRLGSGRGAVSELLGGGPDEVPDRYAAADPSALCAARTRVVLVHGVQDEVVPVDMSRRYHVAFGTELIEVPGGHFDLIDPRSTAWPLVVQALRTTVNGSS